MGVRRKKAFIPKFAQKRNENTVTAELGGAEGGGLKSILAVMSRNSMNFTLVLEISHDHPSTTATETKHTLSVAKITCLFKHLHCHRALTKGMKY